MNNSPPVPEPVLDRSASRRNLLFAAVAGGAAVAGASLAWWRHRLDSPAAEVQSELWGAVFETPSGSTLAMQSLRGAPLMVNFWATWCPPCVEEMPLLDRFYRENRGKNFQVVGLAIDQPGAVKTFLSRVPVSYPIGLAGLEGTELGKALGNVSGGLPFTVVFGSDGQLAQRKLGKVSEQDLLLWSGVR